MKATSVYERQRHEIEQLKQQRKELVAELRTIIANSAPFSVNRICSADLNRAKALLRSIKESTK